MLYHLWILQRTHLDSEVYEDLLQEVCIFLMINNFFVVDVLGCCAVSYLALPQPLKFQNYLWLRATISHRGKKAI